MRRTDRAVNDEQQIIKIIDNAKILHLGMINGAYPYIVPLHYGYDYKNGKLTFYMHGAKEGQKYDIIKNNPNVFVELETDTELISGGDIPCRYGSAYASVMGEGKAIIVKDIGEKKYGLELLMKNQTGKTFTVTEEMTDNVNVIKVVVSTFTAKVKAK